MTPLGFRRPARDRGVLGSRAEVPGSEVERCSDAPGGSSDAPGGCDGAVGDLIEDIRSLGAEFERALRRQTRVILAGLAATLAAAMTPIYLALFAGLGA